MANRKTETLTVCLNSDVKATLRRAATQEHRSLANMVEGIIRDWSLAHEDVQGALV